MLEMGPVEQNIIKQCVRTGTPIPERIANAPVLRFGLNLYMQAFFDLDSERSHGFGLTPIPWSSIKDYAAAFSFDAEQTEDLMYFVRRMDSANLKRLEEQKPKNADAS